MGEELRVHFEMQAEDNRGAGMPDMEARRRARLLLGRTPEVIERVRDQEMLTVLEGWYRDFALGMRAIRKSPVFCFTAILTLALGIGANTVIFALLYGLVLRTLPVANPSELAHIGLVSAADSQGDSHSWLPYPMLQRFRREQRSFSGISIWLAAEVSVLDSDGAPRVSRAGLVSGNAFPLLGMTPYLGRPIVPADDIRGGPSGGWPVVLSYAYWTDRYGADPSVIGARIKVSDVPATIVGVAPRGFRGVWPGDDMKLYVPFHFLDVLARRDLVDTPNAFFSCSAIGRLKPGVSVREAQSEITFHQTELFNLVPLKYRHLPRYEKASLQIRSARRGLPTYFGHVYTRPLFLMQGLVAIVLLLCCVNVGGLMMSKVHARQREFAVRTAIGAARWRLIRQYLMESFVIALAGAALASLVAWYGTSWLLPFFRDPMMGQPIAVQPDSAVFWMSGLCAIATTILFGTLPAWRAGRTDPAVLLTARTSTGNRGRVAGRVFIPIQVALSLVLVALATLLSQSLLRIRSQDPGFDVNHVTIQNARFYMLPQKGNAKLDIYQRMVDRLDDMPGMRSAAVTWYTPMTGFDSRARFEAVAGGPNPPEDSQMAYNVVGPGYFQTMNTRILDGREFRKNERTPDVCVLNQSAANYLFPHQQVLGSYVRAQDLKGFLNEGPLSCRVVGIAEDAKFASIREPAPRTIYFPLSPETISDGLVFLMNSGTKAQAVAGFRKALSEIAPSVPTVIFASLRDQMDAALGSERLITMLSNVFAGLALLLSALGLYGLLSSSVVQRTGEIGVRIALGARRGQVLRMIVTEALGLVGVGVLLGGIALLFAVRFIQDMLFGVSAFDPITLTGTLALLIAVTLVAATLPALRAASIDPIEALRAE